MKAEMASESARRVASYLKTAHGATRVLLFGSAQAQLLSQYYTGLESSFEKGLKLTGIEVSDHATRYHKEILTLALKHQFVPLEELEYLSDLLSFRHFVRHGYGVEFRPEEVDQKTSQSIEKRPSIREALEKKFGLASREK